MYKNGLKLWSINTDYYYKEAQRLFSEGIFDYIELYIVPNTLDTLSKWKKLNIPFVIHASHSAHGFNLADKEKAQSNLEIYKEVKQFTDELGAPYIIFHGGIDGDIKETARQLAAFKETRALIENKPYVALPNKMGGKFCRGATLEEINYIKDIAKCGFCLDIGHVICSANSLGKDIYEYCRSFLQFNPQMFHLSDIEDITSQYDAHPHLGTGQLDFKQIFDMLENNKYITIETNKYNKENLDDFEKDVEWLKNFL